MLVTAPLIAAHKDKIVKVFVSRSHFDVNFLKKKFWFFLSNRYPFCIRFGDMFRFACWKIGSAFRYPLTIDHYRGLGLDADYIDRINTDSTQEQLRALDADIFLFALFDKIAKQPFLAIPRVGTYNLHMGMLPEYRGGLSAFWVLRDASPLAGATLHEAVARLDDGDIVAETRFPVATTSMKRLMDETFRKAGVMMLEGVERILAGAVQPVSKAGRPENYLYIPTAADFRAFYRRGCRLI
jgi:hypothetical protein